MHFPILYFTGVKDHTCDLRSFSYSTGVVHMTISHFFLNNVTRSTCIMVSNSKSSLHFSYSKYFSYFFKRVTISPSVNLVSQSDEVDARIHASRYD